MGLTSKEQKALEALQRKAEEPDRPEPQVTYNLNLESDTAWERAGKLGLIPSDNGDGDDDEDTDEEPDDTPRRRSRADRYYGGDS